MKPTQKPARKCHPCRLNLGTHCWLYEYPRGQWRHGRTCPGFENPEAYARYDDWLKEPSVKSRKDLRREYFRTRRRTELHRDPVPSRSKRAARAH